MCVFLVQSLSHVRLCDPMHYKILINSLVTVLSGKRKKEIRSLAYLYFFFKRAEIILWNDCICKMKVVSTQVLLCAILFYKLKTFQFFFSFSVK